LVQTALENNLGLEQLALRIEQAEALHRQAGARSFPALSGSGSYDSVWRELDEDNARTRDESASAGALLNWELDVWGRIRSAQRAQKQQLDAAHYDLLGGQLLLSASIAETYFEILEQRERLRLLQEQIRVNETLLDLTRLRFGQGISSIVDVLQQQEQLASTRALVPSIEAREGQLSYTLDVLLGQAPGEGSIAFRALPEVSPVFRGAGVPSNLLSHRPDLMAARRRIAALDYRVGEALADRLPRFEIGGALSAMGDPEFSNLYLEAVRDVEIALLRERKQAERVALQESQLDTAKRLLSETRNRYSQGLTDYLPVLAAVTTEQGLERELITSRRELLTSRVVLHRALGGPMFAPAKLASISTNE